MAKTLLSVAAATGIAATAAPATFLSSSAGSGTGEGVGNVVQTETRREEPVQTEVTTATTLSSKPTQEVVSKATSPAPQAKKVEETPFTKPNWNYKLIPQLTSAEGIENDYLKVECLKEYFGKINWNAQTSTTSPNNNERFSNDSGTKSCVVVEYYKQTYTDNKWWGEFRLIWSLKDETKGKGFITVTNVRADAGKLLGSATAYMLQKDSSGNSWTTSQKSKKDEDLNNSKLYDFILQESQSLRGIMEDEEYWGFKPDTTKICGTKGCSTPENNKKKHEYKAWELIGNGGTSPVYFWGKDINNWFDKNFGWKSFESTMYNVYGNWTERKDWAN